MVISGSFFSLYKLALRSTNTSNQRIHLWHNMNYQINKTRREPELTEWLKIKKKSGGERDDRNIRCRFWAKTMIFYFSCGINDFLYNLQMQRKSKIWKDDEIKFGEIGLYRKGKRVAGVIEWPVWSGPETDLSITPVILLQNSITRDSVDIARVIHGLPGVVSPSGSPTPSLKLAITTPPHLAFVLAKESLVDFVGISARALKEAKHIFDRLANANHSLQPHITTHKDLLHYSHQTLGHVYKYLNMMEKKTYLLALSLEFGDICTEDLTTPYGLWTCIIITTNNSTKRKRKREKERVVVSMAERCNNGGDVDIVTGVREKKRKEKKVNENPKFTNMVSKKKRGRRGVSKAPKN
ncbi:hypothetical protein LXL04_036446 [Taraxacum kok-saghyz]